MTLLVRQVFIEKLQLSCSCHCIVVLCGAKGQAFILVQLDTKGTLSDKSQEVDPIQGHAAETTQIRLNQPYTFLQRYTLSVDQMGVIPYDDLLCVVLQL